MTDTIRRARFISKYGSDGQVDRVIDSNPRAAETIARTRRNLSNHHLEKLLTHPDSGVRNETIASHSDRLSPEQIDRAVKDPLTAHEAMFITNKPEHFDHVIRHATKNWDPGSFNMNLRQNIQTAMKRQAHLGFHNPEHMKMIEGLEVPQLTSVVRMYGEKK